MLRLPESRHNKQPGTIHVLFQKAPSVTTFRNQIINVDPSSDVARSTLLAANANKWSHVNGTKQSKGFRDLRRASMRSSGKLSPETVVKYKWKHRILPTFTSRPAPSAGHARHPRYKRQGNAQTLRAVVRQ